MDEIPEPRGGCVVSPLTLALALVLAGILMTALCWGEKCH